LTCRREDVLSTGLRADLHNNQAPSDKQCYPALAEWTPALMRRPPLDGGMDLDQVPRQSMIRNAEESALDSSRVAKPASNRPASNPIASLILFVVVILAPLPFGSVDPLPIVAWCTALGIALSAASLHALDARHFLVIAGVAIVVVAYLLVLHEQVAVQPFFTVSRSDPVWRAAADALGAPLAPSVSMVRDQPIFALGAPLAAVLCLLVSFIVCVDRKRAHQLLYVVAWSGSAYAVYGIAAFLIDPTKVLWMTKQAYFTVLTSTFINRNTAAVYFGSCAIIWLLILADGVRQHLPAGANVSFAILSRSIQTLRRDAWIGFLAFFLCLVAMFLTGSRAGVLLSLLVGASVFSRMAWKAVRSSWNSLGMLTAGVGALFVIIQLLGAGVVGRLDNEGLASGGRLETYRSTLGMIRDHPWLGTGLGTFAWSYPTYRSSNLTSWGVWDRAHNTPLEIASDMGLPLAGLVVTAWAGVFAVLAFGLWTRKRDQIIVVAALATASLGILHSLIDFSLQIPGFAIVVFALVGAGLAQSFRIIPSPVSAIDAQPTVSKLA
jgi:O-antigen ligase